MSQHQQVGELQKYRIRYRLDGRDRIYKGQLLARHRDAILDSLDRYISKSRVELVDVRLLPTSRSLRRRRESVISGAIRTASSSLKPFIKERKVPVRTYARIGNGHERFIPAAWPPARHQGRTDISLDAITDPDCSYVEYEKECAWRIRISTDHLRRSLELHSFREGRDLLRPFTIDIDAQTVEGAHVPMTILWHRAA